jgi:hypothetical protein
VYQRSTNGGESWSAPLLLDARPGSDGPQWFPWVTVDNSNGRVYVFYYDRAIADSGDLMEASYQFSENGGVKWHKPTPLSARPFHGGWGNDTGQPNLGDYSQAVAQNGELFAAFAFTQPVGFTDGLPASTSMTTPDVYFKRISAAPAPLSLGNITFTDQGGNGYIDAGEHAYLTIPLRNYVTNPLNASSVKVSSAVLSSTQTGVNIVSGASTYPIIAAGATANNNRFFDVFIDASTFTVGSDIELVLTVATPGQGTAALPFTLHSGTPLATTLLSENFDSTAPGALPAGWATSHAGGNNVVAWTTNNTFMPTASNAAFHQNANDGLGGNSVRFERLFSPAFVVPNSARYVTIDYDTVYDTEDDQYSYGGKQFNVLAYDGYLLRITDAGPTSGPPAVIRSVIEEAFETELYTGTAQHLPKHFPRSNNGNYFQDMSAWAGYQPTVVPVHMRFPGMNGRWAQLRFEYTQDSGGICTDLHPAMPGPNPCGVAFDNLVVNAYTLVTHPVVAVNSPTGQYSDQVTLTAQITPATTSDGTATGTVDFTVNGNPAGSAAIDGSGLASVNYIIPLPAGPYTIGAAFTSSNPAFTNSSGTGTLTVLKEDAVVVPDATNPAIIEMSTHTSGSFTLKARFNDSPDGFPGDMCDLGPPMTITLTPIYSGTTYPMTATVVCDNISTKVVIKASASFSGVEQNVYLVTFSIDPANGYYQGSAQSLLTVSKTNEVCLATGGGRMLHGTIPAEFGFYAKNTTFQMAYLEHRVTGDFLLKSNVPISTPPSITVGPPASSFLEGTITYPASLNGDKVQLTVVDNGSGNDTYRQRVKLPPTFTTSVTAVTFDAITVPVGDIVVHTCPPPPTSPAP